MTLLAAIVLFVTVTFYAVLPFFYKRTSAAFTAFYHRMALSAKARFYYRVIVSLQVFLVNLCFLVLQGPSWWQFPGLVLSMLLIPDKCTAAIFRWLHDDRRALMGAFALFFVVMAFPPLFNLSLSLGMVMIASAFYPSWVITCYFMSEDETDKKVEKTPENIATMYFCSKRTNRKLAFLDP